MGLIVMGVLYYFVYKTLREKADAAADGPPRAALSARSRARAFKFCLPAFALLSVFGLAIAGGITYTMHRRELAALPAAA